MATKLVIVESPAKAKTIAGYLGSDYEVEASIGHIRDLPPNGKGLGPELKKKWWSDYAVDVDNNFEPFYEVPDEKKRQVEKLKKALKGKSTLVLATDEDREGESISWHLLEVLKPNKSVEIKRIAFHEITRDAIREAIENPRELDKDLVNAQEARRILDRLYGYTLSPVLWTKVGRELSAGRVQSPAVKLIVERERARRNFHRSVYWDLQAELDADKRFGATLKSVDGQRVATGKDFDESTGELKTKAVLIDEETARALQDAAKPAEPWTVTSVEKTPGTEKQPPPFRTTTLQQEANRKFGFPADRTMRIAQDLYEGVEIDGERVGLITYMRTDSLNLADSAITQIRQAIQDRFGKEHLPAKPIRYTSKVANAQEAHEAIRATDVNRTPERLAARLRSLSEGHYKLYDLIYRRGLACQMKPAEVMRTSAEIEVEAAKKKLSFLATGKEITFPGFLLAYVEDVDDAEAELEGKERILPTLTKGQVVKLVSVEAKRHETKPPARYTDASLIKALEDLGIGRPSTYASIISVIVDRGYVRKKGRELIPSFLAFMAMDVLENHFGEFVDLKFTAQMDETLDQIAGGHYDAKKYLNEFFLGDGKGSGLKPAVDGRKRDIPFPNIAIGDHPTTGEPMVVRIGKDGNPFVQIGDGEKKRYVNLGDEVTFEDLNPEFVAQLEATGGQKAETIGMHPSLGRNLILKKRAGYYLEVERTPDEIQQKVKPTWVSLPQGVDPGTLTQEDLNELCLLPKTIGKHPATKDDIIFRLGKFGPYVQSGAEIRNVDDWRQGLHMSLDEAVVLLAQPKTMRRAAAASGPIQEFGELEGAAGPVKILAGRFGPYVTDGTTNATLPKAMDPATISASEALDLLRKKAEAGPSKKFVKKRTLAKKKPKQRA